MSYLWQPQVILLLLAVGAFLLLLAAAFTSRPSATDRRLDEMSADEANRRRYRIPAVERELKKQQARLRLIQAGLYGKNAAAAFATLRVVLFVALVVAAGALSLSGLIPLTLAVVIGLAAAILATIGPSLWLDRRKQYRQTQVRRALPDALDIISVCMEAGLSLPGALARVAKELATAHPLLALEFAIVDRETQLGRSTGDALREFAYRFDLEELRNLAAVILQAEKYGSSLTRTMQVYSETLRQKRHQRAEELAQKASIKILFPTLFCIFPAMFVVIMGPAVIRIYEFFTENGLGVGG
ncbi:MAG: type II secretion system F family protein [Pirellulaceae bacterium]|nr:type II secretion system F family protein [Pirellulaceae bacterium]